MSTIRVGDGVGVAEDVVLIVVIVWQHHVHEHVVLGPFAVVVDLDAAFSPKDNWGGMDGGFAFTQLFDELLDAFGVKESLFPQDVVALIFQVYGQAGIEEGEFAEAGGQAFKIVASGKNVILVPVRLGGASPMILRGSVVFELIPGVFLLRGCRRSSGKSNDEQNDGKQTRRARFGSAVAGAVIIFSLFFQENPADSSPRCVVRVFDAGNREGYEAAWRKEVECDKKKVGMARRPSILDKVLGELQNLERDGLSRLIAFAVRQRAVGALCLRVNACRCFRAGREMRR